MGQLLEMAFVNVEAVAAEALVGSLLPLLTHEREGIRAFVRESEDDVLTIPPRRTTVGGVTINDMSARILRYSEKYDVEFAWDLDAVPDGATGTMVASVHAAAISAANAYGISEYYGGLEPCDDEETRVFTRQQRGPLSLGGPDL